MQLWEWKCPGKGKEKDMQQKQKKTEVASQKANSFAKMMLQRDKDRAKAQQKHAYMELLKAPRGKEYLRLLAESSRLCEQLAVMEEEIKQLETQLEQESSEIKVTWKSNVMGEASEVQVAEVQLHTQAAEVQPDTQTGKEQSQIQVSWKRASLDAGARIRQMKEKQQRLMEMKRQRERVAEQFRKAMQEFEAQLPAPDKLIGMIWPDSNTEILLKYGVIPCPGFAFGSPEELIEQVKPKSEKEEQQWLKGNEACHTYGGDALLIVEIYMEAICVVYKDGNTIVIE